MMFKKFKEIASAWIEASNPTPESQALAEKRIATCNGCSFRKKNTTVVDFYYCGACGCPLNKKIFSTPTGIKFDKNLCPKQKWEK